MGLHKDSHDVNHLPVDGYLFFPLSMSRLNNTQNPEECYKALQFFEKKIKVISLDVIFLYTNGLYYNNTEPALDVRKRTNGQMLSHKNAILKLVLKHKKYVSQAIHFLPWDYVILNAPKYQELFQILNNLKRKDKKFYGHLIEDLTNSKREENEANINFLIEEIVVTHLIRQKMIEFPKTLVRQDNFRLIVYPGQYLKADLYQWKNNILWQNIKKSNKNNPYYASHYDLNKKIIYNFDEIII